MGERGRSAQAIMQNSGCISVEVTLEGTPSNTLERMIDVKAWKINVVATAIQVIKNCAQM